jgi:hypothetical protein
MTDPRVHRFAGRDGLELAYRETADGRPLVLLFVRRATLVLPEVSSMELCRQNCAVAAAWYQGCT